MIFVPAIYDALKEEYKTTHLMYRAFIESKQLGVVPNVTLENERIHKRGIFSDYYTIVDPRRWLLTKIRYGIDEQR